MISRINKKQIVLYVLYMIPFVLLYLFWGQALRLATILVAFGAMWSLWVARQRRKSIWTIKTKDIWLSQMLWTFAAVEANVELWYRHTKPSVAILLVDFILILSIKGVFNQETKYTIDQV